jgi:hypothetical protein
VDEPFNSIILGSGAPAFMRPLCAVPIGKGKAMSKGLGRVQRAIVQALALAPPEALPWGLPPAYVEAAPEAPLVPYWAVPEVRRCVARLRGAWCAGQCADVWQGLPAGERRRRRRVIRRGGAPPPPADAPHAPHPTWGHAGEVAFSRALHGLVDRHLLQAVDRSAFCTTQPCLMPIPYSLEAQIAYVVQVHKC